MWVSSSQAFRKFSKFYHTFFVEMHRAAVRLKKVFHTFTSRQVFIYNWIHIERGKLFLYAFLCTNAHVSATGCHLLRSARNIAGTAFRRKTFNTRWGRVRSANTNEQMRMCRFRSRDRDRHKNRTTRVRCCLCTWSTYYHGMRIYLHFVSPLHPCPSDKWAIRARMHVNCTTRSV